MHNHTIDNITENILTKLLNKFTQNKPNPETQNPNAALIAKRQHQFNSRDSFNTSWKREDQPDISHIIDSIRNLNPEQRKIFTSKYQENFGDTYPDKLSPEQLSNLQNIIKSLSTLKEINSPPRQPKKSLELIDQGLKALDTAIDLFHKAMDADPITHERKPNQDPNSTLLHHILTLENTYDSINEITPNPISPWGSLPGEDHKPVDTGKYNPHNF